MCNCNPCGCRCNNQYGFFNFMVDGIMICVTAGFWLIWIFVREMRKNRCR